MLCLNKLLWISILYTYYASYIQSLMVILSDWLNYSSANLTFLTEARKVRYVDDTLLYIRESFCLFVLINIYIYIQSMSVHLTLQQMIFKNNCYFENWRIFCSFAQAIWGKIPNYWGNSNNDFITFKNVKNTGSNPIILIKIAFYILVKTPLILIKILILPILVHDKNFINVSRILWTK